MAAPPANDTIAAIATAPGAGGIGIVRLSGPWSESILRTVFRPAGVEFSSHRMYYGTAVDGAGLPIDEVLAVLMRGPRSYTREDVVEIHCHGSSLALRRLLQEVLRQGARPAEPGEFTKRAFLAGRIDLTRAEAVIDLIEARTEAGAALAAEQMQGALYAEVESVRQGLVECMAILEVAIDFPEDDVEILDTADLLERMQHAVIAPLDGLIARSGRGRVLREGVKVVIAGRPNVGKSSLLNALLMEERALVTDIPGTTRDTIEEWLDIHGIPVQLVDTAGIREHVDPVEGMGVERARQKLAAADLVLFLVDASAGATGVDLELYTTVCSRPHLVLFNKVDIARPDQVQALQERFGEGISLSAKRMSGMEDLLQAVERFFLGAGALQERAACMPNLRHKISLERTLEAARRVMLALEEGVSVDLLAVEMQSALDQLGDIVGLTTPEDVLDTIFSRFCIGK